MYFFRQQEFELPASERRGRQLRGAKPRGQGEGRRGCEQGPRQAHGRGPRSGHPGGRAGSGKGLSGRDAVVEEAAGDVCFCVFLQNIFGNRKVYLYFSGVSYILY